MIQKQKLELTWIGKENRPQLEPRILLEDQEKSYHAKRAITGQDIFDNSADFRRQSARAQGAGAGVRGQGEVRFIDPPYNTGSAFTHYDDGVEHSLWLSLMRDRLELIRRLLVG